MGLLASLAVIIHWGDPESALELASSQCGVFERVVIVANDGSGQPTELTAGVTWLVPERNLGYAGACQWAADLFPARLYAFLNNDLAISPEASSHLLGVLAADPQIAVVGPTLYDLNGTLQAGAASLSWGLLDVQTGHLPRRPLEDCQWVTGAAFYCNGDAVRALRFTLSYFLGAEDADFCYRARSAGWRVVATGEVRGVHVGAATIAGARWQYYVFRNRVWFARTHRTKSAVARVWLWSAFVLAPRVLLADVMKRRGFARTRSAIFGVAHAASKIPAPDTFRADEPVPSKWLDW